MKKVLLIISAVVLLSVLIMASFFGIMMYKFSKINYIEKDKNLTIMEGNACNTVLYLSNDKKEIILVDTKMGKGAEKAKKYIDTLSDEYKVTIIITHDHPDNVGGIDLFKDARIITGDHNDKEWREMTGSDIGFEKIKVGEKITIKIDDEIIQVRNKGQGHTMNDVIVYFENRKLIVTGDLVFNKIHPAIFRKSGTNIAKWIEILQKLETYDVETVVPGHGEVSDKELLSEMKEYFVSIKDAINDKNRLNELKKKYKNYFSVPKLTSFYNTVSNLKDEVDNK